MKKLKRAIVIIIVSALMLVLFSTLSAGLSASASDGCGYPPAEEKYNFADDAVVLTLTREETFKFKQRYSPEDFPGIGCIEVIDLNPGSTEKIEKQLAAEKTGDWSELKYAIDVGMLMDVNVHKKSLLLKLGQKDKDNVIRVAEQLQKRADILSAGPNYIKSLCAFYPNDEFMEIQWAIYNTDLPIAWEISTGSSEVKVGVLDTGIDAEHPDLINQIYSDTQDTLHMDFTDEMHPQGIPVYPYSHSNYPLNPLKDPESHGSHVSGIICAETNNGIGISGTAWDARLVSLRVLDEYGYGETSYLIKAIDHAEINNIPILNFSGAGLNYDPNEESKIAEYSGLFVCAAGNISFDSPITSPSYPGSYILDNLISVGSSLGDYLSNFSKYGLNTIDIFAPGSYIFSTIPGGEYDFKSGTSMAAPMVAGVAVLVKAKHPNMPAIEIKAAIMNNVATASTPGNPAFTYTVISGELPEGLTFTNGSITGTPEETGEFNFTVRARAAGCYDATASFSITVNNKGTVSYSGGNLTGGKVGTYYNGTAATATGAPSITYALAGGSNPLPAGLGLAANGALTGIPTANGTFTFTVTASADDYTSKSAEFTIVIAPVLTYNGRTLTPGQKDQSYTGTAAYAVSSAGAVTITYALASVSNPLPTGLGLASNGALTGTPTVNGAFTFTVTASAAGHDSVNAVFTLVISDLIPVHYEDGTLTAGKIHDSYTDTVTTATASGSPVITYALAVSSNPLPAGLNLASNGALTGTPTASGTFTFTITASAGAGYESADAVFTIVINNLGNITYTYTPQPFLLTEWTRTVPGYSVSVATATGTSSITYTLTGNLPNGLAWNNGLITGTPTAAAGEYTFTVTASATDYTPASASFTIKINALGNITYTYTPQPFPLSSGTINTAGYSASVATASAAGNPAFTYTIISGNLPNGITFTNGAITGTPTETGTFEFTVRVSATGFNNATASFSISVNYKGAISYSGKTLADGDENQTYIGDTVGTATGAPSITYAVKSGSLPNGLSLNGSTGLITGTPTVAGDFVVTVTASAADYESAEASFNLHIEGESQGARTFVFGAEHTNLTGKIGGGLSYNCKEEGILGAHSGATGYFYLLAVYSMDLFFDFAFVSDRAETGSLTLRLGSELGDIILDDTVFGVEINGVPVAYGPITVKGDPELLSPGGGAYTFQDFIIAGNFAILQGENKVTLRILGNDLLGSGRTMGPAIDSIRITTAAGLSWINCECAECETFLEDFVGDYFAGYYIVKWLDERGYTWEDFIAVNEYPPVPPPPFLTQP